jgi:hypothetical protein
MLRYPSAALALLALAGCASTVSGTTADASSAASTTPPITQIAGAGPAACALRMDGHVRCWRLFFRATGDGGAPPPVPVVYEVAGLSDAREVAVYSEGDTLGCAVRATGEVACWQRSPEGAPVARPVAVPTPARHVAVGATHACVLDAEGAVFCWGHNEGGELGAGDLTARDTPTRVGGLAPVVELRAAEGETCARTRDGAVWCWGRNYAGALGDGVTSHGCPSADTSGDCSAVPVRVAGITAAEGLSVGLDGACVLQRGQALCWGWGTNGRLGTAPSAEDHATPNPVPGIADATAVFSGYLDGCAIRAGGVLSCWGIEFGDSADADGGGQAWLPPTVIAALPNVRGVTGGWYQKCALQADGAVSCWGGRGTYAPVSRLHPLRIEGL